MPELQELRYPFQSAMEFFSTGYWSDLQALHLTLAYVAAVCLIIYVFRQRVSTGKKLLLLYFALTPFNNFAFQVIGASPGDLFGVLAAAYFAWNAIRLRPIWPSPIATYILAAGVVFVVHQLLIAMLYPRLNEDGAWMVRVAVTSKVFVLGAAVLLFFQEFKEDRSANWLVKQIVNFALISIAAYFIQVALLLSGHIPYGTFLDTGLVGRFPSFGSVSLERGHFGKFLTPLFPFFLLAFLKGRRWPFYAFVLVTLINFSASSMVYFLAYLLLTLFYFRRIFARPKTVFTSILLLGALSVFVIYVSDVLIGIWDKIYSLGIQGGEEGGRGLNRLMEYLHRYPFGISYSGSSLRIPVGMEEMNSGLFSFITQLSFLSPFLIFGFAFLAFKVILDSRGHIQSDTRNVLITGIILMFLIFSADVFWFVPTVWLPMILCGWLTKMSRIGAFPSAQAPVSNGSLS